MDCVTDLAPTLAPADDPAHADLRCPLCDYPLRGLPEPRCPECGYAVESWDELRRRVAETHPFLYEHHPERPWSARARTLLAGLNPWRFWASVRPEHRVVFARLVRYWIGFAPLLMLPPAMLLAHVASVMHFTIERERAGYRTFLASRPDTDVTIRHYGSIEAAIEYAYPRAYTWRFGQLVLREGPASRLLAPFCLFACFWPWLVVPAMYLFALTLRRAQIRPAQVFRCAVYCWDVLVLAAVPMLLATIWMMIRPLPGSPVAMWRRPWQAWHLSVADWFLPVAVLLGLLVALRLGVAFGRYLNLRHAIATALLIQTVLGLLCAKLMFVSWGY